MSVNAIAGVSLYEYFYTINRQDDEKKKKSPLADEMRKYGLKVTGDETLNAKMLQEAKRLEAQQNQKETELPKSQRPWADIMYQLNIPFNDNPKDDIDDIKKELSELVKGLDDDELNQEVKDLENEADRLYLEFLRTSQGEIDKTSVLESQMKNLQMLNMANML